ESIEGDSNVMREDAGRANLICFVQFFPPMHLSFDGVAHERMHLRKLGKIRIVARTEEADHTEYQKNGKGSGGVTPGAPEGAGKIMGKEFANALSAVRLGAIDAAMR